MLNHIGIYVEDLSISKVFYADALAPLGYKVMMEFAEWKTIGFGDEAPDFWISEKEAIGNVHVAFTAKTRAAVDAFHAAALKAGGRDNGKPGIRTEYSPNYYAAFVHDPDANNIEVVCMTDDK